MSKSAAYIGLNQVQKYRFSEIKMSLYQIGGALPPADEFASILGMLVGKPDATFRFGKTYWNIVIQQKESDNLIIRYESESADQDLHLRRLERYSGTIVFLLGVNMSTLKQFGFAELIYGDDLLVLALEHETIPSINKYLKGGYNYN